VGQLKEIRLLSPTSSSIKYQVKASKRGRQRSKSSAGSVHGDAPFQRLNSSNFFQLGDVQTFEKMAAFSLARLLFLIWTVR